MEKFKLRAKDVDALLFGEETEETVKNSELFNFVTELASKAEPNRKFRAPYDYETDRWYFYLPIKLEKPMDPAEDFALIPFTLVWKIGRNCCPLGWYELLFPDYSIEITHGKKRYNKLYKTIIKETERILPQINKSLLENHIPYIFRGGKIKRKYILGKQPELTEEEAKKLLEQYKSREKKEIHPPISLRDYLRVAGYCLKAVFPEQANLSDKEIYDKHADFRRPYILEIDEDDPEAFKKWFEEYSPYKIGTHPFEILAGHHDIGIVLRPPVNGEEPFFPEVKTYILEVDSPAAYSDYLKCVKALIKKRVTFEAVTLEDVLSYLTGEAYLSVNRHWGIIRCDGTQKFTKYVEWELPLPKLKT